MGTFHVVVDNCGTQDEKNSTGYSCRPCPNSLLSENVVFDCERRNENHMKNILSSIILYHLILCGAKGAK